MENKKEIKKPKYGRIEERYCLHYYVSEGIRPNGQKFELAISDYKAVPMVICGNKTFSLYWDDICSLAEEAGLFNQADEEVKNGKQKGN